MQFEGPPPGAVTPDLREDAIYTVTEVYPDHVVLDGNHPLAGIALRLSLVVRDVREASEDEIEAGSVAGSAPGLFSVATPGTRLH
jgi:FKBP-type peptidyl-prolyl cis-trans isomerase SlyD